MKYLKLFESLSSDIIKEIKQLSYILEDENFIIKYEDFMYPNGEYEYWISIKPNPISVEKYRDIAVQKRRENNGNVFWTDYFIEDVIKNDSFIEWNDRVVEICHKYGYTCNHSPVNDRVEYGYAIDITKIKHNKIVEGFKDWFKKKPSQQKRGEEILNQLEHEVDPDDVSCVMDSAAGSTYNVNLSKELPPEILSVKMRYDRRLINSMERGDPELSYSVKINNKELDCTGGIKMLIHASIETLYEEKCERLAFQNRDELDNLLDL